MAKKWNNNLCKENASKMHKEVFSALKEHFSFYTIEQEFKLEVYDEDGQRHTLFMDFFIKELSVAIECQGRQHFEQNAHFHAAEGAFKGQQSRDSMKKKWCDMNDIPLVEVRYDDKISGEFMLKKVMEAINE